MISYVFLLEEEPAHRAKMDWAVGVCIISLLVCIVNDCVVLSALIVQVAIGNKSSPCTFVRTINYNIINVDKYDIN